MAGMAKKNEDKSPTALDESPRKLSRKRKNGAMEETDVKKQKKSLDEFNGKLPTMETPVLGDHVKSATPKRPTVQADSELSSDDDYSEDEADFVSSEGSDSDEDDHVTRKTPSNRVVNSDLRMKASPKAPDDKKAINTGLNPTTQSMEVISDRNQKEAPTACSVKEVLVVNHQNPAAGSVESPSELVIKQELQPVMIPNPPYDVTVECPYYFALSQMRQPKLTLRDIRESIPPEAYEGRTLSLSPHETSGYQVSLATKDLPSSALQFMLNTLMPANSASQTEAEAPRKNEDENEVIEGRCVVCATLLEKAVKFWHNLREEIDPPSLRVPIRWVLASLSIAPVKLTPQEKEDGRVSHFSLFLKEKKLKSFEVHFSLVAAKISCLDINEVLLALFGRTLSHTASS